MRSLAAAVVLAALLAPGCRKLAKPEPGYAPSTPNAGPTAVGFSGPKILTIDATDTDTWAFVDLSKGTGVKPQSWFSLDWDLAIRRFHFRTNGGKTNPSGPGGIVDLGVVPFDSVSEAPEGGYLEDQSPHGNEEPMNPLLVHWYDYSMWTNTLKSKNHVYALRTANGRYAKFRIVGYYCPDGQAACMTLEYAYQGDGSRQLAGKEKR